MKTVIEMARAAGFPKWDDHEPVTVDMYARLVELVRADERNSWPAEMEAMERQVNILTDALAKEREACAKIADTAEPYKSADLIRARSNT